MRGLLLILGLLLIALGTANTLLPQGLGLAAIGDREFSPPVNVGLPSPISVYAALFLLAGVGLIVASRFTK